MQECSRRTSWYYRRSTIRAVRSPFRSGRSARNHATVATGAISSKCKRQSTHYYWVPGRHLAGDQRPGFAFSVAEAFRVRSCRRKIPTSGFISRQYPSHNSKSIHAESTSSVNDIVARAVKGTHSRQQHRPKAFSTQCARQDKHRGKCRLARRDTSYGGGTSKEY